MLHAGERGLDVRVIHVGGLLVAPPSFRAGVDAAVDAGARVHAVGEEAQQTVRGRLEERLLHHVVVRGQRVGGDLLDQRDLLNVAGVRRFVQVRPGHRDHDFSRGIRPASQNLGLAGGKARQLTGLHGRTGVTPVVELDFDGRTKANALDRTLPLKLTHEGGFGPLVGSGLRFGENGRERGREDLTD